MNISNPGRRLFWITACMAMAAVSGCTTMDGWFHRHFEPSHAADAADSQHNVQAYLSLLQNLADSPPATQKRLFQRIEAAAKSSPTPANTLRLALALGTPGHPASDPKRAAKLLRKLLGPNSPLGKAEQSLAAVYLANVEQRLNARAKAQQRRQAAARKLAGIKAKHQQEMEAAAARNRQLQKQLDEAKHKLTAITQIEQSIRERDHGTESVQSPAQANQGVPGEDSAGR